MLVSLRWYMCAGVDCAFSGGCALTCLNWTRRTARLHALLLPVFDSYDILIFDLYLHAKTKGGHMCEFLSNTCVGIGL